ncbi:PCYA1 [Auxenochlorella protothecoides x Auxenochlorella symbiontica]
MEGEEMGARMEREDKNTFRKPEGAVPLDQEGALDALRMGTWRLRGHTCSQIEALVAQIEGAWRTVFGSDFRLYQLDRDMRFADSIDMNKDYPSSWAELMDPTKDEPGYPRLMLENRAYQTRVFRKVHLEVGIRQDNIQILHCTMYPRLEYDLPILSIDVVSVKDRITLALADPCPVNADLRLPEFYAQPIREMQERYSLGKARDIPAWASSILSPLAVVTSPATPEEVGNFIKYAITLVRYHTEVGRIIDPVSGAGAAARLQTIRAAHKHYCTQNLRNLKTRRMLEASFGVEWSDKYLRHIMFDFEG